MKITFINGNYSGSDIKNGGIIEKISDKLSTKGFDVKVYHISNMNFKACNGCWSCWVKTPGECASSDESSEVLKRYMQSDLVVFWTGLKAGFISAETKNVIDKIIPLYHPYITIKEGELDHFPRYAKYPGLASVFYLTDDCDQTDFKISDSYMKRVASQFYSKYKFTLTNQNTLEEIYNEITGI